jgi:heme-degrading monooxygenase HmoA
VAATAAVTGQMHLSENETIMNMTELDTSLTLRMQMDASPGAVVLVNVFRVPHADAEALVTAWADDARYFKRQPGFISAQLHRGIARSSVFFNYAVWESPAHFRRAFENPEFQAKLAAYPPDNVASPHLFQKLAIPDICVA